jgi:hypothetical protein
MAQKPVAVFSASPSKISSKGLENVNFRAVCPAVMILCPAVMIEMKGG